MNANKAVPKIWFHWLFVVVIGVMLFGISMILMPGLIRAFFSLLVYSAPMTIDAEFSPAAVEYITLLHGVLGAVMFGWGAIMLMALCGPFRRGSKEGWNMLTVSVAVWFVPDTVFSLGTGFWQNAVLNAVFAVLFAVPLAATYKAFGNEGT